MRIDREKVHQAVRSCVPLSVRTHTLSSETTNDLEEILGVYLGEMGRSALREPLGYVLRELAGNARKANFKNAYFRDKGLDIANPEEYCRGMETWGPELHQQEQNSLWLLEKEGLHLKVSYLFRDRMLSLSVRNNSALLPADEARVRDIVSRAWAQPRPEESLGTGLGGVVMILRKIGLSEDTLSVEGSQGETVTTLKVPVDRLQRERAQGLSDELVRAVENLPPFPDNLRRILGLLEDPEVAFADLAKELAKDPGMTADLIKYINSAAHRGPRRIEDLDDAVRQVGIQGLKDLLFPYGAHQVLGKFLEKQEVLWENAATVSRYALAIARERRFDLHDKGLVQISGLLYNLGQIVASYLDPQTSQRILEFCRRKHLSVVAFDELTQSVNPVELGARIASKWRFPQELVSVLAYQADPASAPGPDRSIAAVVHLASCLRSIDLGLLTYRQIPSDPAHLLGLDPAEIENLHGRIRKEG